MPIPFRADLQPFLTEFVEQHRGIRLGKMFGLPAAYVGRRLCACLIEDGVIVRLPDEVAKQEMRRGGSPFSGRMKSSKSLDSARGKPLGSWVKYQPKSMSDARKLARVLEVSADHLARRQIEDVTGVKLRRK